MLTQLKQLQVILTTFMMTLSSLVNVGSLMILIIYIYAVIGISLFSNVKSAPPMSNRLNFQSIFNAFMALIQVATGENWNGLLDVMSD
jgi:voltage-gated cation channel